MPRLDVHDALRRAEAYRHGVLSWVGADGYPVSVAATFEIRPRDGVVVSGPVDRALRPHDGQEVNVTFSHIRPRPGEGYDQRRYVTVWGTAHPSGDRLRVRAARATGWDEREEPFFEYCERSVPRARRYFGKVGARPRLSPAWLFFLATRLPFLTATWVPVGLGAAIAASHGPFSWGLFGWTMLGASALHLGLNIANDLFDDAAGVDAANPTPTPFSGGSRVMQHGLVSRAAMVRMCVAFYAIGIATGVYLAETRGRWLYAIGGLGIAISLLYSGPPLRIVNRGWGDLAVAAGFGPVTVLGSYFVQAQALGWEPAYASLPVGVLTALILYVNEIPDRRGDEAAGKDTLVVRLPRETVIRGYALAAGAGYGLVAAGAAAGILPVWTLAMIATAPMASAVHRGLRRHYDRPYDLIPAMQANIGLHLFAGLLLIGGYLVHGALS